VAALSFLAIGFNKCSFYNDPATTEHSPSVHTLALPDAPPICLASSPRPLWRQILSANACEVARALAAFARRLEGEKRRFRE
jgi:hypothetical protein